MATMKDIAKRTGLGLATISKYLNGGNVRERNRLAIDEAVAELGYTVNEFARGLKTNKSYTVGVVIPELNNTFVTSIITIVEDLLRTAGYGVITCGCKTNEVYEAEAIQFLLGKNVDGIINMPVTKDGSHLTEALAKGIPVVLFDRMIEALAGQVSAVLGDNSQICYDATQLLIDAGHRRIALLLGEKDIYTTNERLLGYQQALRANHIAENPDYIVFSDYTVQGGYRTIKKILQEQQVTAAFVTNYEMTLGSMIAINELGIEIPAKLSMIGFDDLELSQIIRPQLTIVNQPLAEIATNIVRLFLALEKEAAAPEIVTVALDLQAGASIRQNTKR